MIDSALYHRLAPVARRFQLRRLFMVLATTWTLATMAVLVVWWLKSNAIFHNTWLLPGLVAATFLLTLGGIWLALRDDNETGLSRTARDIEQQFPELDASLITAVQQQPVVAHGNLGYLQQEVVRKAVYHGYQNHWARVVPQWHMLALALLAAIALLALLISALGTLLSPAPALAGPAEPGSSSALLGPALEGEFAIEPGDVEIERFTSFY